MYKLVITVAACFFAFILWIIYLADSGGSSIFFRLVRSVPYGDKVGHLCLFGTLTLLLIIGTRFKSFSIGRLPVYYAVALVTLFVVVEEFTQAYIPTRTFDLIDLTADSIGILAATGFSYWLQKKLKLTAQTN